jgi:trans-2,3-dihydro-3-hydroxyanthranilate isomerase
MTRYLVYDVFTDRAFGGNPLAVIPDASGLVEGDLQRIAREFNLSETTFVYPPGDQAHTARVRIFTPASELPFAGHPTVGTALALHDIGRAGDSQVLELGVGPIPVVVADGRATFETRVPLAARPGPPVAQVADMLSLPKGALVAHAHEPINASVGGEFLFVEVASEEDLAAAAPALGPIRMATAAGSMAIGVYPYVRRGNAISARLFAPEQGITEDPATGSAAAALAALLGRIDGISGAFTITQGVTMGRPSLIEAGVTVEDRQPVAVTVGGRAVPVMEGRLVV